LNSNSYVFEDIYTQRIRPIKIKLGEHELFGLYILYKCRYLTGMQIADIISASNQITKKGIHNKIYSKYIKSNILVPYKVKNAIPGVIFNYYRIGANGLRILCDNFFITEKEAEQYLNDKHKIPKRMMHFFDTQSVVINTLSNLYEHRNEISLEDLRLDYMDKGEVSKIHVDSVLKYKDRYLYIEMDTGSEGLEFIRQKIQAYGNYAKSEPDRQHILLLAYGDRKNLNVNGRSRSVREGNIKQTIVGADYLQLPNLHICITDIHSSFKLGAKLLLGEKPYNEEQIQNELNNLIYNLNQNRVLNLEITNNLDVSIPDNYKSLTLKGYQTAVIKNKRRDISLYEESVLLLYMEEGNVRLLDQLDYYYHLVIKGKIDFQRIIVVYDNPEELLNDKLGYIYKEALFVDSYTAAMETENDEIFYHQLTKLNMGVKTFEWQRHKK